MKIVPPDSPKKKIEPGTHNADAVRTPLEDKGHIEDPKVVLKEDLPVAGDIEAPVPVADEPHEFVLPETAERLREELASSEKLSRKQQKALTPEARLAYKKSKKERKKADKLAKKRKKRSKRRTPVWQIIMLIVGLSMLAYPIVADRISAWQADQAITTYTTQIEQDPTVINALLDEAQAYNDRLSGTPSSYTGEIRDEKELIVGGGLPFAWIEFPTLAEKLPIYHGTEETSLQSGVGHLERTSLPIGGNSTHTVLTGHSGMPGNRMFDDIDRLAIGDVFLVHTLNQDLAYKVISTEVVWPDEVESLVVQPGRDLCTLITCTPYGVNDHRLLVHAERTDYDEALSLPSNNMALFFNQRTIPFIIAIIVTVLFFLMLTVHRRRRHPLEIGVDKSWNGLSDYTDDRRRFIGYDHAD